MVYWQSEATREILMIPDSTQDQRRTRRRSVFGVEAVQCGILQSLRLRYVTGFGE